MTMRLLIAAVLGLCTLHTSIDANNLKNGPSGFQKVKLSKSSKTIDFTHTNKSKNYDGDGQAAGKNSADLNVKGEQFDASKKGKHAQGRRNGKKATAEDLGGKNYAADAKGKNVDASVDKSSLTEANAGKRSYAGNYNKNDKEVYAYDRKGKGQWESNLNNRVGHATEIKSGRKVSLRGIKKGGKKVRGYAGRKKIDAGRRSGKSKISYARVQEPWPFRRETQYASQTKKNRGVLQTRIAKGRDNTLYHNSVNNKNEASLHERRGSKLATLKAKQFKDVPCPRLPNNMWREKDPEFKFYDETMDVEMKKKDGAYVFPSCMDIAVDIKLPKAVHVKDLAAAVTVIIPSCGEFSCGKKKQCLTHNCFYKTLCPDPQAKPSGDHKDAGSWATSQTEHNACSENLPPGGRVSLFFKYCPDVNADIDQKNACDKAYKSKVTLGAAMTVQIDVWTVKQRPMGCNLNNAKDKANVRKLGCKKVEIDYVIRWEKLPNFQGFLAGTNKAFERTNCNLGKRPCVGHDPVSAGELLGWRNKGRGRGSSSSRGQSTSSRRGGFLGGIFGG